MARVPALAALAPALHLMLDSAASESEFDALRAARAIRPRVERSEPLPPVYPRCAVCGSEAPTAEVYDCERSPQLVAVACLCCAACVIAAA